MHLSSGAQGRKRSQDVLLALQQLLRGGTDVKWEMPISLGWVAEAERRKAVSQAQATSGEPGSSWRAKVPACGQCPGAQLRSAGGTEGRYCVNPVPGGWLPATVGNSNRRFFSREHSSSTWTKSQGLGHVGKARTQLQRSASHKQVGTTCCYHRPKHPMLASFKCDVGWEGRERVQMRPMKNRTWEFPAFCTWVESPDFSLGSHYHS